MIFLKRLDNNVLKNQVVDLMLCYHVIVSYLLESQVVCSKLHEKIFPITYNHFVSLEMDKNIG